MSLVKRTYVDQETVITAENLNAIQDAIIENEEAIGSQGEAIEGKYSKPAGGIPATDMASGVQTSLGKADSAYQKPSGGIPATDMASGVQTSLGKADSAYQKPSGGIPASDMASAVQTSLGKAESAYQKPSGGIPATDMASGVQTSLGKADSAYQKPSGGIPATDMASGVQTSLGKADSALQSSDIDSTLTVTGKAADAKKTGDEISGLKNAFANYDDGIKFLDNDWVYGSIESDGSIYPYQDRISMASIKTAGRNLPVTITNGYKIIYCEYNQNLTIKNRYAGQTANFTITEGTIYRISIYPSTSTGDPSAPQIPIADLSDKATIDTNTIYEINNLKATDKSILEYAENTHEAVEIFDDGKRPLAYEWVYGSIENDGSIYPYPDRISMAEIATADRKISVTIKNGYKIIYCEYNQDLSVKARFAGHTTDFVIAKGTIYRISIYPSTSSGDPNAERIPIYQLSTKVTMNTNVEYQLSHLSHLLQNIVVTVNPSASESEFVYKKFADGLAKAMEYTNAILLVKAGTYDIISEIGGSQYTENYHTESDNSGIGLRIGNNIKIIAEENAVLVADYEGANRDFGFNFSILCVTGSFEIDGLTLKGTNIRYCVHEDVPVIDPSVASYTGKYKNCKMYHYANNEYGYSSVYCIGAGTFHNSRTEIENCYFYSAGNYSDYPVEYHNYSTSGENGIVIIKDNYFADGKGLRFYGFASNGSIVDAFVSNNRFGRSISINGTADRINLNEWNNQIDN